MKNCLLAFSLVLSLTAPRQFFAQGDSPEKSDLDQLQGEWLLVFSGGRDVIPGSTKWAFKGDEFRVEDITNKLQFPPIKFVLHSTANPKKIDITFPDGRRLLGMYKMEADTLTISRGMAPGYQPKEFMFQPGIQTHTVLKRVKK